MTTQQVEIYQGQFGEFTITQSDRTEVIIYRAGLAVAALSLAIGSIFLLSLGATPTVLQLLTPLFGVFSLSLAISLVTIHIYLALLQRLLQLFWLIGTTSAIVLLLTNSQPLALVIYNQPLTILGIGFTFAALTGIYFKEAFCFNRLETKLLTFLVPGLLLGHITSILPTETEKILLALWTILFMIFVGRKTVQPLPPDIGDKSVFVYLKEQNN
ncbi:MAG: DUF2301 domain-containing membrane protein [Gomphosphaeria aponina SAG 52.96 = DSM 107014]|uniref:DUF2301 domain-containing membrane protein n=1 Tax=Gomphosphaeria aponina SAG 52.96 = DSM 107014 TaxID=1521640 RepID=A0A941JPS6_9CHRO|nr:DUF2301 domain-containing membrane protein [Gomphosphaeria aponina SAG 52.96 = DSM 107014]